jgi:hypothetical protein
LVSIVTPTFPGREQDLFNRCVPSVMKLDWDGPIEHIIVSDRNPEEFDDKHNYRIGDYRMRSVQINETWRNPTTEASTGAYPWMLGSRLALGEFVGFLGDDDELLPHHARAHIEAMRAADAVWSVSKVDFRVGGNPYLVIGDDTYELGHLDTTGVMCWQGALQVATWNPNGENASDWQMVRDWRQAGLRGVFVDRVTGIHHDGWAAGKSGRPDRPQ